MIVFAHGLEGRPDGRKATTLRAAGFEVVAPDGRGKVLAERIPAIVEAVEAHPGCVLVGSSYGGLAALVVAGRPAETLWPASGDRSDPTRVGTPKALVLCAPALTRREPPVSDPDALWVPTSLPTVVLHGLHDRVVPIAASRRLAARCPHVVLRELDDDHALTGSLPLLVEVVRSLDVSPSGPA